MEIREDDISQPEVIRFLNDHLQNMIRVTPPGCVHALDVDSLRGAEITFWVVWEGGQVAGCGALKDLGERHGEIKSMRTAPSFIRKGIASALLRHVIHHARQNNFNRLSLETGSYEAFRPARELYAKFGFTPCCPFSSYLENVNSVYMTLRL